MAIKYAILGFLSWQSLSGYDLKKLFEQTYFLYWSGNNNQIYRTLVQLHKDGFVTTEYEQPESGPTRKIYTISERGRAHLREWLLAGPEMPQIRQPFFVQLMWSAENMTAAELDQLLAAYEHEVQLLYVMCQEHQRRAAVNPARSPREQYLWQQMADHWADFYAREVAWVQKIRVEFHLHPSCNPIADPEKI